MTKPTAIFDFTLAAPSVDQSIQDELLALFPRVFLRWSKAKGRWELWSELTDVSHPGAKHTRSDKDRWNNEAQCWMRYLQVYQHEDGRYAPADERLIWGLWLADTWANRRFYEERIEDPEKIKEMRQEADRRQLAADAARYHYGAPNPIVGRHVNSGWRRGTY